MGRGRGTFEGGACGAREKDGGQKAGRLNPALRSVIQWLCKVVVLSWEGRGGERERERERGVREGRREGGRGETGEKGRERLHVS